MFPELLLKQMNVSPALLVCPDQKEVNAAHHQNVSRVLHGAKYGHATEIIWLPLRFSEALSLVDTAIAMLRVAVGPDNPNVATALAIKVTKTLVHQI